MRGFFVMAHFIYILYSESKDNYYVGYSKNLKERLSKHNQNHKGFTGKARDWRIVHTEEFPDKNSAVMREKEIKKKKSRKYIEFLVNEKPTD